MNAAKEEHRAHFKITPDDYIEIFLRPVDAWEVNEMRNKIVTLSQKEKYMLVQIEVEVRIRKGMGPETFNKNFSVGFDDLPEEITDYEIEQMAKNEVESQLRKTEDYRFYGKNWEIIGYNRS